MTILRTGSLLLLGAVAVACTAEGGIRDDDAELTAYVTDAMAGPCVATQCIDVVAEEHLLYLSVEGGDCQGDDLSEIALTRFDAAGDLVPVKVAPMWGTSDASCIGKSEKMWHFHRLAPGTYRVCATFHGTITAGSFAVHARAAGGMCISQPFAGRCSRCDDGVVGRVVPSIIDTSGSGGTGSGGHAGGSTGDGGAPDHDCDD